ncbi:MAG TPA: response regulator transcription factor [Ktedonobacterales bacterium]|jgi:DNA-binding NarL/FixJ family response regulator|nr:response regulator transcription factor [Ktedonobacterales bacterium]
MHILIVSGHKLIGQSLVAMIKHLPWETPVEVRLCDPRSVIEQARTHQPGLILVEASVDFGNGIMTVRTIAQALPDMLMVVLGSEEDEVTVFEAILAGAYGYVARDTSADVLLTTLRSVYQGELGLSRSAAQRVIRQMRRAIETRSIKMPVSAVSNLTQREQEIFELVRRGLRSRDIAQRLCIAEATVYKHTQNILDKLHVHSRTQAIFVADIEPLAPSNGTLDSAHRSEVVPAAEHPREP